MLEEIYSEIREYLRENMGMYIFVSSLFLLGLVSGVVMVVIQDGETFEELHLFFEQFTGGDYEQVSQGFVFQESLRENLVQVVVVWLSGMFAFGFPVAAGFIFFRGFTLGFAVAFLVENASFYGILFSLGAILPHNLLIVPAFLVIAVTGFSLSFLNFKERYIYKNAFNLKKHLGYYSMLVLLMFLMVAAGCLVEAYISTVFIRLIIPVMP